MGIIKFPVDKIQNGQWEKEIRYVMTNDLLSFISEDQNRNIQKREP